MDQVLPALAVAAIVVVLMVVGMVALGGLLHWTKRQSTGYFTHFFYLALLAYALLILSGGRDFSMLSSALDPVAPRNPLVGTFQKITSILLVLAAGERIFSYVVSPHRRSGTPVVLTAAFALYWVCTVALTAWLGANQRASHDMLYPLLFGVAATLANADDAETALLRARNALLGFTAAGWVLLAVAPDMAADFNYMQGFLPGVPRFAGLAAHAVGLGMLAQVCLLCLWTRPLQHAWLNRLCWAMGLLTLFLAQSKTAWMSFVVCAGVMAWVRSRHEIGRAVQAPKHKRLVASVLGVVILLLTGVGAQLMFGNVGGKVQRFFDSAEGAQLTSLTGRDQIWAVTWQEWERNPIFGYGLSMFDLNHRFQIGISAAFHAHNQFMDTLGRSGTVGAVALTCYAVVLLYYSLRFAKASQGLSVALFTALALRAISEVPLTIVKHGPEFFPHLLLLFILAGCAGKEARELPQGNADNPKRARVSARLAHQPQL